ncbi:hypothetical protein LIPSTDRAFT_67726 [Lipomyces starkeyi NRRL Y-11557]|uniref:Uncharacterized protein n=1 Tax=Lipomyces starkeyi NRRL Y-11557 TaxID=675824 RepID=A0A1E3QH17_LIPST|nr:hypothetical protein LIPSTDRAFT_67726 [Lipomyces starkeyi NRRL Y-11557]
MGNCFSSNIPRRSSSSSTYSDKNRRASTSSAARERRQSLAPIPSQDPALHRPVFQQPMFTRHRSVSED